MSSPKDTQVIAMSGALKTNPFGKNVSGEHAYVRAERIVNALYLLTNHVPYEEPLRAGVRSNGHALLRDLLETRNGLRSVSDHMLGDLLARVRELETQVQLLHTAGYISRQNTDIVVHALDDMGQLFVASQQSSLADAIQLRREDLAAAPSSSSAPARPASAPASDGVAEKPHQQVGRRVRKTSNVSDKHLHDERQGIILDILKRGGKLGIKDIATQMVGCSEKTVQRELAKLISNGHIQKEGEKRWSTYSLA